jgi:inorganic pyrophosphatase
MNKKTIGLLLIFLVLCGCRSDQISEPHFTVLETNFRYKQSSSTNLLEDIEPLCSNGLLKVVIEIPAGTNEKWEVAKDGKSMKWEFKNGKPRVINYLGYPGNYGFVPRTLLPKEKGGDGDPLDIIVLGNAVPRGKVIKVKLIGVLKMLDRDETDDKLIGIHQSAPFFSSVDDIDSLDKKMPGILDILKTWFKNYKGPGKMEITGVGNSEEAQKVLNSVLLSLNNQRCSSPH